MKLQSLERVSGAVSRALNKLYFPSLATPDPPDGVLLDHIFGKNGAKMCPSFYSVASSYAR